jgi:hypothetical protein
VCGSTRGLTIKLTGAAGGANGRRPRNSRPAGDGSVLNAGLGRTVEDQPALQHDLANGREPGLLQRQPLLNDGHVQRFICHSSFADEVITYEIYPFRRKHRADLGVQRTGMAFVSQFVNSLIGYNSLELSEAFNPMRFLEGTLDKLCSCPKLAETNFRQFVHRAGKIEHCKPDIWVGSKQMLGKKPGPGADFKHSRNLRWLNGKFGGKSIEEFDAPRSFRHGRHFPFPSVAHETQVDWAWNILAHLMKPNVLVEGRAATAARKKNARTGACDKKERKKRRSVNHKPATLATSPSPRADY